MLSFSSIKPFFSLLGSLFKTAEKWFNQPKLAVRLRLRDSTHYGEAESEYGMIVVLRLEPLPTHELHWDYELTITSNSEYPAYNIRLSEPTIPSLSTQIDETKPILGHQSATYNFTITKPFKGTSEEASRELSKCPFDLFVFEYSNAKGKGYKTLFKPNAAQSEPRNSYESR